MWIECTKALTHPVDGIQFQPGKQYLVSNITYEKLKAAGAAEAITRQPQTNPADDAVPVEIEE